MAVYKLIKTMFCASIKKINTFAITQNPIISKNVPAFGTKKFLLKSIQKPLSTLPVVRQHNSHLISVLSPSNYRTMSTGESGKPSACYQEVKQAASSDSNILLVDVREPPELVETGVIPCSINIPLGELENVLKNMSEEEFEKKFGRKKPVESSPIIVSCQSGKRSDHAQDILLKLGYTNVKNYPGGWLHWADISEKL